VDASPDLALDKEGKPYPVAANLRKILRTVQHKYKLNMMDGSVEYEGAAITDAHYGAVQEELYDVFRAHFQRPDVINAVYETAAQNPYRPVKAYLEGLPAFSGPSTLPVLCKALGVEASPLHIRYLECFLIGAARRGLCDDPRGVKHDTMLVLQGPQGAGKSSFFALLGGLWFSDTPIVPGNKDAYDACRNHWIIEWPEIDRIKDHATTKAFITSQVDSWRRVFQMNEEKHPRRCVFVGTTNKDSFLNDDTGSRRYHVLRITRAIDHALIDRDRVWAEAVAMAAAGKPHWLSHDEDRARAASNADVQVEERWQWLVEKWLAKARPEAVTINQVLEMAVQLPPERWANTDLQEVGRILKRLGYERKNERLDNVQTWVYRLPEKLRLVEKALDSA
jgi:putative DNA primase/helicase